MTSDEYFYPQYVYNVHQKSFQYKQFIHTVKLTHKSIILKLIPNIEPVLKIFSIQTVFSFALRVGYDYYRHNQTKSKITCLSD